MSVVEAQTLKALFDNTKKETAGNSDWIIDADQPIPLPSQVGITQSTSENYWLGAISAWGVDLVKSGFTVHTLTSANGISYGNSGNPYDLSNYNLFVVCEPQNPFSTAEKQAIKQFVQNGGGLMMVADHNGSDRDNDGWDSPKVWNDLQSDTLFGIHFQSAGESDNNITQVATNVASAGSDSVIMGPAGAVKALSYHNGTTMRLLPAANASAAGRIWMNGSSHGNTQIVAATAHYGQGKAAGVGDSSPADDGSAQAGNSNIFDGWHEVGATDDILFLNLCLWLTTPSPVVSPPVDVTLISPSDSSANTVVPAVFMWQQQASATNYELNLSLTNNFASFILQDSSLTDTANSVANLSFNTTYYWRVRAKNGSGWGPFGTTRVFMTWDVPAAVVLDSPTDSSNNVSVPVHFRWFQRQGASVYRFLLATSNAFSVLVVNDSILVESTKTVSSLALNTFYFWKVCAKNDAGWGDYSSTRVLRTWHTPDMITLLYPPNEEHGTPDPTQFTWRAERVSTEYEFDLSVNPSFNSFVVADSALSDTAATVSGLDSTVAYYWRVRGRNTVGWGPFSETRWFTRASVLMINSAVNKGWNLLSLPLGVADSRRSAIFPMAVSQAFTYDNGYKQKDTLISGEGYWLKFDSSSAVPIIGQLLVADTITLKTGWALVGPLFSPLPANAINSIPSGIVASPFFGFDGSYHIADALLPMQGYWVKSHQNGKLILSSGGTVARSASPILMRPPSPAARVRSSN